MKVLDDDGPEFIYTVSEIVPYFTIQPVLGIYVTYFPDEVPEDGTLPAKEIVVGPYEKFIIEPIV